MTPHLRGYVRAYVDRALPEAMLHMFDRHLVCCELCRAAAEQERRIVAALRSDTGGVPMSLRSSLMGLGVGLAAEPDSTPAEGHPSGALAAFGSGPSPLRGAPDGRSVPPVPTPSFLDRLDRMPVASPHAPVPTVAPTSPPLHRSPVRAAVVASIAAGASVAAAWGLAVAPLPGTARGPVVAARPDVTGAAALGLAGIGATTSSAVGSSAVPVGMPVSGPVSVSGSSTGSSVGAAVGSAVSSRVNAPPRARAGSTSAGESSVSTGLPASYWLVRTGYARPVSGVAARSVTPSAEKTR
jgi:hypothetical protein